jgi:hypothetical protein
MATPQIPDRDASPTSVRNWFVTILTDLHSVSESEARDIASKWKYGRGSELLYYDVDTFRVIFGGEAGTLLFGHARRELRSFRNGPSTGVGGKDKERKRPTTDLFGLTTGCESQTVSGYPHPSLTRSKCGDRRTTERS